MMSKARYSIGIDLGTTNCALGYAPLEEDASASQILPVSQWDSAETLVESDALPSFLYFPLEEEAKQIRGTRGDSEWIAGRFARNQAAAAPGRVVSSAKSWLSTGGVDQSSKFLPWGGDQIPETKRLSPVDASACLLNYLASAWDASFAKNGAPFSEQEITVTVPASFEAPAQRLTLQAARDAAFPDSIRLLEEPQAAFYRWLETHDSLPKSFQGELTVLVVDIGGGTSDFSLFQVSPGKKKNQPEIRRIAVSDHILLGGDNIDLAMAHVVAEVQLKESDSLSPEQWSRLIAQCRSVKEECLNNPDRKEKFTLSIPGSGSGLIGSTVAAELSPDDVNLILFEGFYPECGADEKAEKSAAGLREFGLPYARDHAVTRHLAEFLWERPRVEAVLFNGGSLEPESIRRRIAELIGSWQESEPPEILPNAEPGLAVARGAACYGWLLRHESRRIQAGAPRSVFLEVRNESANKHSESDTSLVCILPKGTSQGEEVFIDDLDLSLQTNEPVSFQILTSTRADSLSAGEIVSPKNIGDNEAHRLPPLETIARAEGRDSIPVSLSVTLNALGLLQLECVDQNNPDLRWPLEFNLSGRRHPVSNRRRGGSGSNTPSEVSDETLDRARRKMDHLFSRPVEKRKKLTANLLVGALEKILATPKQNWDAVLLRKLWETHAECLEWCYLSADHEEAWLTFAGFLLRPGYGVRFDEDRVGQLWRCEEIGYDFPGKRIDLARQVMWRRVAGGLNRKRQETLAEECLETLRNPRKKPSAEAVRLAGALERVGREKKSELRKLLLDKGIQASQSGGYVDPYWTSLTLLLNRAPIYAGPETVLPPDEVEDTFSHLGKLDWTAGGNAGIVPLFLRAARLVDNPAIDLPHDLRKDILKKLRRSETPPAKLAPLREFVEVAETDQISLLGEPLPPGIEIKDSNA